MPSETVALGLTQPLSVAIEVGDSDRRLTIEVAHVDDSGRDGEPALALAFSDGCARLALIGEGDDMRRVVAETDRLITRLQQEARWGA